MNKIELVDKLFTKKTKDYSFTIIFFLVFSFFIFFVIKPNVTTVFSLQRDLDDLRIIDKEYEKVISNIITIQSAYEKNRSYFYLLGQALPTTPQVNQVVDDIKRVASDSGLDISKIEISQVNLKGESNVAGIKSYGVNINTISNFSAFDKFMQKLIEQRRIKIINKMGISKEGKISSDSSNLRIQFEIEGYYL